MIIKDGRQEKRAQTVGQLAYDILSNPQPEQTVGDTLEAWAPDYEKALIQCVEDNSHRYKSPFYVFVLTKKEYLLVNTLRNWFIARQTPPHCFEMLQQYGNHTKTLYIVDAEKGAIGVLWSIPGFQECLSIASQPHLYDPTLVRWIEDCFNMRLEKDKYTFDDAA